MAESEKKIDEPYLVPIQTVQARAGRQPIIETQWSKSKDSRYVIVKTIFTEIKPVKYLEKILQSEQKEEK